MNDRTAIDVGKIEKLTHSIDENNLEPDKIFIFTGRIRQELKTSPADKSNLMPCRYCDMSDFRGKLFDKTKNIDGGNQQFEICLFDSPEDETPVIEIDGTHTDIRIAVSYCPKCGRKL